MKCFSSIVQTSLSFHWSKLVKEIAPSKFKHPLLLCPVWLWSTYRQLLWQWAEESRSCIDVGVEQLQQAGGPDGLWCPSCRFNTPVGDTQAFISSLVARANTLESYQWPWGGIDGGGDGGRITLSLDRGILSRYQREVTCGNSDEATGLIGQGQTWAVPTG